MVFRVGHVALCQGHPCCLSNFKFFSIILEIDNIADLVRTNDRISKKGYKQGTVAWLVGGIGVRKIFFLNNSHQFY